MISIFGQFSGNGLGYFNTTIFEIIGVTSVELQLAYNLLNSVLSAIGALAAVAYTDTMPRRKVLVFGTLGTEPLAPIVIVLHQLTMFTLV